MKKENSWNSNSTIVTTLWWAKNYGAMTILLVNPRILCQKLWTLLPCDLSFSELADPPWTLNWVFKIKLIFVSKPVNLLRVQLVQNVQIIFNTVVARSTGTTWKADLSREGWFFWIHSYHLSEKVSKRFWIRNFSVQGVFEFFVFFLGIRIKNPKIKQKIVTIQTLREQIIKKKKRVSFFWTIAHHN